jgi:hypothetical protein
VNRVFADIQRDVGPFVCCRRADDALKSDLKPVSACEHPFSAFGGRGLQNGVFFSRIEEENASVVEAEIFRDEFRRVLKDEGIFLNFSLKLC